MWKENKTGVDDSMMTVASGGTRNWEIGDALYNNRISSSILLNIELVLSHMRIVYCIKRKVVFDFEQYNFTI